MVKTAFSTTWKHSVQSRKQRKYRYNAPLHLKGKMIHVHLSPSLRQKYGIRSLLVRKGDKVKISRGQHRKKEGKVEKVVIKRERVFVTGVETIKKDGSKILFPLTPSNLIITDLDLSDKKRKSKLESKNKENAPSKEKKQEEKKEIKK